MARRSEERIIDVLRFVDRILVELEKRGMIKRLKGRNRAIAVCESALQETEVRR